MVRMRCSVFEKDEETPGCNWKAGRRVARCEEGERSQ